MPNNHEIGVLGFGNLEFLRRIFFWWIPFTSKLLENVFCCYSISSAITCVLPLSLYPSLFLSHSLWCVSSVSCVAAGYRVDSSRRVQQVQVPVLQVCAVSTCDNHPHFLTAQLFYSQASTDTERKFLLTSSSKLDKFTPPLLHLLGLLCCWWSVSLAVEQQFAPVMLHSCLFPA